MKKLLAISCVLLFAGCVFAEVIGVRPYEMDWANRYEDAHPAIVDFEKPENWTGFCEGGVTEVQRSREQQLFGDYVLKVTYHNTVSGGQTHQILAEKPIPVPAEGFDTITLWCYGDSHAIYEDKKAGAAILHVVFRTPDGRTHHMPLYRLDWHQWYMCHHQLSQEEKARLNQPGTVVIGFSIKPSNIMANRTIYLDSLCLYTEEYKPLTFEERPQRGIPLFPGQDPGANTGTEVLPFPNRLDTILPDSAAPNSSVDFTQEDNAFVFTYQGEDGTLKVTYSPKTGMWDDFTVSWNGAPEFQPLNNGGAKPTNPAKIVPKLLSCKMDADGKVRAVWKFIQGGSSYEVTYAFCLKGKTLVLDTTASNVQNVINCVTYGEIKAEKVLDVFQTPFYDYAYSNGRPAVALIQTGDQKFFVSGQTDWYLSNASKLIGGEFPYDTHAQVNGQATYIPKTDGTRNDVYERFFVTISPKYEEHLPVIPNPTSPWKHVTGTVIWRAHGAQNRDADKAYWRKVWRYGMRKCLITDHETGWRDCEESFTFRTRPAPGKGGVEGWQDYSDYMQNTLGFVYGPYNNFTDFAPVNEFWDTDMVIRESSNQLMHAWRRCYAPKALRGVEFCKIQAPINEAQFHFSTAYCDVHTSCVPWDRTDFDPRTPGAGTFNQVFYAYGEIMLLQKAAWDGPVYSEGPHFCYYAGLTDGNYGQDRTYRIYSRPWLVDFALRRINEKECDFGIGNVSMFYGEEVNGGHEWSQTKEMREKTIDRFLAATLAFGHTGFLVMEDGIRGALRSYHIMQQIQSRYTQSKVQNILYGDEQGQLYPTSQALINGAYKENHLAIDYEDGTHLLINGNPTRNFTANHAGKNLTLIPNSFLCWTDDGEVYVFSGDHNGQRVDYVESPEYIYFDGRDRLHHVMPKADGVGCAVCRKDDDTHWEIIPYEGAQVGFAIPGGDAHAFDYDGNDLGPARTVRYRGMLYVMPVEGAFSYKVDATAETPETALTCQDYDVVSDTWVAIHRPNAPDYETIIHGDVGERIWVNVDGQDICFVIRRLLDYQVSISQDEESLLCLLKNPGETPVELTVSSSFDANTQKISLGSFGQATVAYSIPAEMAEGTFPVAFEFANDSQAISWYGGITRSFGKDVVFDGFDRNFAKGSDILNTKTEASPFSLGASVMKEDVYSGGVKRHGIFMHPPWRDGVLGITYTIHKVTLPDVDGLRFQGYVGKKDSSYPGDGLRYWLGVTPKDGKEKIVAEVLVPDHNWYPISADLTPWRGQDVTLRLITDSGPNKNSEGDWGCWGDMEIIRDQERIHTTFAPNHEIFQMSKPDDNAALPTEEELANARSARLIYQAQGLNSTPEKYPTYAKINDAEIGVLKCAFGNEDNNAWSDNTPVELPQNALKSLRKYNILTLENPDEDCFKVTGFYLEVTLKDGRVVTSRKNTAVFSQPEHWKFGEGIKVPQGELITIPIAF